MLDRTQAFVHLARYDGHLSRRFFRAVKQLADLRRDERKSRETRPSAGSYTAADPYRGSYVPAQAPPPIDGGARGPGGFSKMHGKSRARQGAGPQAHACGSVLQRASSHRRGGCTKRGRKSLVAHTLSVPRRDSSRRLEAVQPQTTKQTQSRRTPLKSTVARAFLPAVSPFVATSIPVVTHAFSVPRQDSSRRLAAFQPKTTKQTQSRRTPVESTPSKGEERHRGGPPAKPDRSLHRDTRRHRSEDTQPRGPETGQQRTIGAANQRRSGAARPTK